ncbi:MAG: hypothetical protein KAJ51_04620, partial [Thermoplasmata archaeon]|nr:hypothetical protein [Thermoplasmata archaeon]
TFYGYGYEARWVEVRQDENPRATSKARSRCREAANGYGNLLHKFPLPSKTPAGFSTVTARLRNFAKYFP